MGALPESHFRSALARQLADAVEEVGLPYGRADVMTPTDVFEVEPLLSWKRGAQQALAYGQMSGKRPNLALFAYGDVSAARALSLYLAVRDGPGSLRLWAWTSGRFVRIDRRPAAAWRYVSPLEPPPDRSEEAARRLDITPRRLRQIKRAVVLQRVAAPPDVTSALARQVFDDFTPEQQDFVLAVIEAFERSE